MPLSLENIKYNIREGRHFDPGERVHAFITCYYLGEWPRKRSGFGRPKDYNHPLNAV